MRLLGIDFETTGLDPIEDRVTEVGMVLWDTDRKCPLLIDNFFVFHPEIDITEEITRITGIRQEDLEEFGVPSSDALRRIVSMAALAEAFVAHNGEIFDKLFLNNWLIRIYGGISGITRDMLWIDTMTDVDYPERFKTKKLPYLAADHGFLNPFSHRAVFDVLTMMVVLNSYNIDEVIFSAKQSTVTLQAVVKFEEKQLAKDAGFHWNADRRQWLRRIKEHLVESQQFRFHVKTVEAE